MLDDYLARIGLSQRPDSTPEGLAEVQRAHRMAIGFENFDVVLRRPIAIDPVAAWAKLGGRRGGYCYEHNAVFGAVLAALGWANRPLLARVWLGLDWSDEPARCPPRTHTLRLVRLDGALWLADAGFGGSYVPPMPLVDGAAASTPDGARHRLTRRAGGQGEVWLFERQGPAIATDGRPLEEPGWAPQYAFDLAEVAPVDLELANWWTSTRPGTRFTTDCRASIVLPDGFAAINGRRLTRYAGSRRDVADLTRPQDWQAALADLFHIELGLDQVAALGLF